MYRLDLCNRAFPLAILASLIISACGNTPAQAPSLWSNSDIGGAPDISDDSDAEVAGTTSCISSAECTGPNKVCDPLTKACVACLYDPDCAAGSHCESKACEPFTACKSSLHCKGAVGLNGAEQTICDKTSGECVECTGNDDCPDSSECIAKRCVAFTACGNSGDCPANQVCDPASKRCAECAAPEDCPADHTCEAGQCKGFTTCGSDKQCTPLGLLCDKAKGKCAQCLSQADCPAVYHCSASGVAGTGECKLDVCKADQGQCDGNTAMACLASGSGFGALQVCPAQTTCAVEGGVPACKPWLCQAGFSCVGDKAVQCRADGLEVLVEIDCAASGQTCQGGECKSLLCKPNQTYCDGNTVKLCNATGQGSAEQKTCGAKEYCDGGVCKTGVCAPNQPVCDGNVAKVCNAQGAAFQGPGKDCGNSAACVSGACLPKVCPAGGSFCEGNVVKVCDSLGVSASAQKTCGPSEFCSDGACKAQVCAPNQPACDGNVATVCNAQGSGYSGASTDCASKKCIGGVCSALVCPPATLFCEGAKLKSCSPDGLSVVAEEACATGNYCGLNKSGDAACLAWVCEPGKTACNGTAAMTCKADGSGYQDAGKECLPPICTALIGSVPVNESVGPGAKVDIVVWIDTSGSMSQEAAWTNQNMNKFTQYLENQKIDYHLVLYGTGLGLCIGPPLGDTACNSAQSQKFLTIKQAVASTNGLTMMQTQTNFDKFKQFLRADAVHHMIGITDDQSATPAATFHANYSNRLSNQGLNPKFVYHAICSFINANNPNQAGNCPTGASYGSQHIALAQSTGGTLYQVCQNDWTAIFDGLSKAVAATTKPGCTYKLPLPANKTVTWKNVKVSHVENQKVAQLTLIAGESACAANPDGWYYDDPLNPTTATVCAETCKMLVGGAVVFDFGCPQI